MTQKKLSIEDVKWEFRELGGSGCRGTYRSNGRYKRPLFGRSKWNLSCPNLIITERPGIVRIRAWFPEKTMTVRECRILPVNQSHRNWTDPHYLQINLNKDANSYTVSRILDKTSGQDREGATEQEAVRSNVTATVNWI